MDDNVAVCISLGLICTTTLALGAMASLCSKKLKVAAPPEPPLVKPVLVNCKLCTSTACYMTRDNEDWEDDEGQWAYVSVECRRCSATTSESCYYTHLNNEEQNCYNQVSSQWNRLHEVKE